MSQNLLLIYMLLLNFLLEKELLLSIVRHFRYKGLTVILLDAILLQAIDVQRNICIF